MEEPSDNSRRHSALFHQSSLFRSRLSPSLADALLVGSLRSHFATFLSNRGSAAVLRFVLEADSQLKPNSSPAKTDSLAKDVADACGLFTILKESDFERGLLHCLNVVMEELRKQYFEEFKTGSYFANYQLELLNETLIALNVRDGERLTLDDVVFCDFALFYFREFLERLPAVEQALLLVMLNFYLAAAAFAREYNAETALSDALALYDRYLSLNAARPLQLPDTVRRAVEESISVENGHPSSSTFDPATSEVQKLLSGEGVLGRFFFSAPFQVHLLGDVKRRAGCTLAATTASPVKTNSEDDRDSVCSSSSAPTLRRVTSLRVARIDELTGAYISEFKDPQFFEGNDSASLPVSQQVSDNRIKRIFSLRGSSNKAQLQRNQELEAERKAADIITEINNAILSSSS